MIENHSTNFNVCTDGAKLRWGSWEFLGGPMHSFPC